MIHWRRLGLSLQLGNLGEFHPDDGLALLHTPWYVGGHRVFFGFAQYSWFQMLYAEYFKYIKQESSRYSNYRCAQARS